MKRLLPCFASFFLFFGCLLEFNFPSSVNEDAGSLPKIPTSGETTDANSLVSNRNKRAPVSPSDKKYHIYGLLFNSDFQPDNSNYSTHQTFKIENNKSWQHQIDIQGWRLKKAFSVGTPRVAPKNARAAGETRGFWIQNNFTDEISCVDCVLAAQGHGIKVWWAGDELSKTPDFRGYAQKTISKFQTVYLKIANIFGEPASTFVEGKEMPDKCINIVLSNLNKNNPSPDSFIGGYFWPADYCEKYLMSGTDVSNHCKCFMMDSEKLKTMPATIFSTLAHEFTHMCNFSAKCLTKKLASECETWWTEMCAMTAEDIVGLDIGISEESMPWYSRSEYFLAVNLGLASEHAIPCQPCKWLKDADSVLSAYAVNYLFGAFLLRNYGGVPFFHDMATNNEPPNEKSIEAAIPSSAEEKEITTSGKIVKKFYECILNPEASQHSGVCSFNNVGSTQKLNGIEYNYKNFSIWNFENARQLFQQNTTTKNPSDDGYAKIWYEGKKTTLTTEMPGGANVLLAFDDAGKFVNLSAQ